MKVRNAMHRGAAWCAPDTPLPELARIMREMDIGCIPIGENDRLIGMVTDRDIVCRAFVDGKDPRAMTAREVMTEGIVWCREDEELDEAAHRMEERMIRRMPVIDHAKRMSGMLSLGDVCHAAGPRLTLELTEAVAAHHA